jgi:hypothetical protein
LSTAVLVVILVTAWMTRLMDDPVNVEVVS